MFRTEIYDYLKNLTVTEIKYEAATGKKVKNIHILFKLAKSLIKDKLYSSLVKINHSKRHLIINCIKIKKGKEHLIILKDFSRVRS